MRKLLNRSLWIGNAGDLWNIQPILEAGIEAVVELADSEVPARLPREMIHCLFPLSDGGENPDWLVRLACEVTAEMVKSNINVLVCCSAGMNRSICIGAGAISIVSRGTINDSMIEVTHNGPVDVSPRLISQIHRVLG